MDKIALSLEEVYEQIQKRDQEDEIIDRDNRQNLEKKGLKIYSPKRFLKVDTSKIVGIENVIAHILDQIKESDRVIAIEGLSGVGKSSTSRALKDALEAVTVSFGEVFRYLTYMHYIQGDHDHRQQLLGLNYSVIDNNLCLCRGESNLSHGLKHHLHDPELSTMVPSVAADNQHYVIEFVQREVYAIKKQTDYKIVLEGRSFSLDFLPCDLRIELCAHPLIRAKRRLSDIGD